MAKQTMIQHEKKLEHLIFKQQTKRESIKKVLKTIGSFQDRLALYKKIEKISRNSSLSRHCKFAYQLTFLKILKDASNSLPLIFYLLIVLSIILLFRFWVY